MRRAPSGAARSVRLEVARGGDVVYGEGYGAAPSAVLGRAEEAFGDGHLVSYLPGVQGVTGAWECTAAQAGAAADSLHACPIPLGSRGRVSLAQHMISRAFATLRLTAPTDKRAVDATLGAIQKHANGLVFGRRWWLTEKAAPQPRSALGRRPPACGKLHAGRLGPTPPRRHGQDN